jgi:hypothetical protein
MLHSVPPFAPFYFVMRDLGLTMRSKLEILLTDDGRSCSGHCHFTSYELEVVFWTTQKDGSVNKEPKPPEAKRYPEKVFEFLCTCIQSRRSSRGTVGEHNISFLKCALTDLLYPYHSLTGTVSIPQLSFHIV